MQPLQPGSQIKRYLVKRKRKPTGNSIQPNKRSTIVADGTDWEDITTDDSSSDSVSQLNQQPPKMSSKSGTTTSTIPTLNAGLSKMEEQLHTKLTSSLTANITENLRSFIDSKLDEALNKMTESMASLVANDSSLQQQKQEMVCLKADNKRLTAKVLTLEIEQNKFKTKLDQMEQKSLDHCLVIRGIPEGLNEGDRECVDKIYAELSNTVESSEVNERLVMACRMEIKRARRIGCYNPQYSRPLSVEFKYRLDTDYIMENRGYLNEGVYVDREYTDEIEWKRKMLLQILKTARHLKDYKKKCKLEESTLTIRGRKFTLNNLEQLPDQLSAFKCTSKADDNTVGFFGAINPLSNFHPAPFRLDGVDYISSEQYIQAKKAEFFNDQTCLGNILSSTTSLDCKVQAKNIKGYERSRWEEVAEEKCTPGIRAKFEQNQHLMDTLIEKTGSKKNVECANDCLWGTGVNLNRDDCLNSEKWISPGILGKILEGIRDSNMQNRLTDSAVPSENTGHETVEDMQTENELIRETPTVNNEINNTIK